MSCACGPGPTTAFNQTNPLDTYTILIMEALLRLGIGNSQYNGSAPDPDNNTGFWSAMEISQNIIGLYPSFSFDYNEFTNALTLGVTEGRWFSRDIVVQKYRLNWFMVQMNLKNMRYINLACNPGGSVCYMPPTMLLPRQSVSPLTTFMRGNNQGYAISSKGCCNADNRTILPFPTASKAGGIL